MDVSTGHLFASLFVSTIGLGFFLYGKKQNRMPQLLAGILLSGSPYFVHSASAVLGVGAAGVVGLWLVLRAGL